MSLIERLFGGISIQLMYIRCMTFIHVMSWMEYCAVTTPILVSKYSEKYSDFEDEIKTCYIGTIDVINIFEIIYMMCSLELYPEYSFTFHWLRIKVHIMLRLDGSTIDCKWCHSLIPDLFLIVNFYLLKATFKKNILSIDMWLVLHGLHLMYMLSVDVFTNYYAYTLMYTCVYCIYLSLVISFRMEERNNSIFHKIINYLYQKIEYLRMK